MEIGGNGIDARIAAAISDATLAIGVSQRCGIGDPPPRCQVHHPFDPGDVVTSEQIEQIDGAIRLLALAINDIRSVVQDSDSTTPVGSDASTARQPERNDTPLRKTAELKEKARLKLTAQAMALAAEHPFMTANAMAAELGISRPTLYRLNGVTAARTRARQNARADARGSRDS